MMILSRAVHRPGRVVTRFLGSFHHYPRSASFLCQLRPTNRGRLHHDVMICEHCLASDRFSDLMWMQVRLSDPICWREENCSLLISILLLHTTLTETLLDWFE